VSIGRSLRNGQWRRVVEELSRLQDTQQPIKELKTEIAYLRRHGEAGRLSFVSFRRQGLPCGSGAIESSIRRVIKGETEKQRDVLEA